MLLNILARVIRPPVKSERELAVFVVSVTAFCVAMALAADVANQMLFFVDWTVAVRSWTITTLITLVVAAPVARIYGKAHLELHHAKQAAEALSLTDPLTGLPNRRALMEAASAANPHLLALVIFDIDRFKRVNDTYGHIAGDAVIRSVGQMMAAELGPFGNVARIGGEEFALLSAGAPLERLANQLIAFCERIGSTPIVANGLSLRVTISAGVAVREPGRSFEELYAEADRALYAAKLSGRNRIHFAPAVEARIGAMAQDGRIKHEALPRRA